MSLPTHIGPYTVVGPLAHGGTAEILLAIDQSGRRAAIKWLAPQWSERLDMARQFDHEVAVLAALQHPNVVAYRADGVADGRRYVALQYLRGRTLAQLAADAADAGVAVSPNVAVAIALQAAAGLHAAHSLRDRFGLRLRLVHRDVAARNLFVTTEGHTKLIDFGISTSRRSPRDVSPELLAGTPGYRAPEQASGVRADRRADVFGLGAVLFELLTGVRPPDDIRDLPRPSELASHVPPTIERVALRALAERPSERHATARHLGDELASAAVRDGLAITRSTVRALGVTLDEIARTGHALPKLGKSTFSRLMRVDEIDGDTTLTDSITWT